MTDNNDQILLLINQMEEQMGVARTETGINREIDI